MSEASPGARGLRPVFGAWLLLSALTCLPYLRAGLYPPRGSQFLGVFYSIPDVYNYLSYVQQAEDGAFLFVNKLTLPQHPGALVNLEWWVVGRLSRLIGRHPIVAYRIFGLGVLWMLLVAVDRCLSKGGLPLSHRQAALLLVFTGAGFGGLLYEVFGPPAWRFLDLTTGLFPIISALVNPHFVVGTTLLLWSLLAFSWTPGWRGQVLGLLLASALGLVRPYDLLVLVGVRVVMVLAGEPRPAWVPSLLPLAGLAPVAAYNYWVFYRNPAFTALSSFPYTFPPLGFIALAFAPAALLAGVLWWPRRARPGDPSRTGELLFVAWILTGLGFLAQPVSFSLQCLVNFGLPLLALGALGLGRLPRAVTIAVSAVFFSTGLLALRILLSDNGAWYVPAERLRAGLALRAQCRPGEVVFSPPDIGLYANAYSGCKAYASHFVAADYDERAANVRAFYESWTPAARAAFLDRERIRHLLLPGGAGAVPESWLGSATPFRQVAAVGDAGRTLALYRREPDAGLP